MLAFFRPEASTQISHRTFSFAERVAYQRAIEEVYWRHHIWPKENLNPKPSLDAVMSQAQLEKRVEDYLRSTQALQDYWQRPITGEQLQAEMDRMAQHTKQPEVLRELFEALGNDPFLIAECLVRPVLSERLITSFAREQRKEDVALSGVGANSQTRKVILANATYTLPTISNATTGCTPDTWTATSTTNAPVGRSSHTAVWTGSEMIIWGGGTTNGLVYNGGRYNPSTDGWTATSTTNAPSRRAYHTAVWTGSEMIVWGGIGNSGLLNTGGRYNPSTNSWTSTSITNAPEPRQNHTAVWTDSEMIIWGGYDQFVVGYVDTGGRYNPSTDSWTATSTTNAPDGRWFHTAVWTSSEMIVWGGSDHGPLLNSGGRYNPSTDSWTATSITNAPDARIEHTAAWTGSEMIVWGGISNSGILNTGGRYDPSIQSWTATNIVNAPSARANHTAVWTRSEMIVWGGDVGNESDLFNTGGRYCAQSGSPTPTPTPTATATPTGTATPTATATQTPRPTPTPRSAPTSKPRPTPAPRP